MSKVGSEIYEFGPFRLNVGEHLFARIDGQRVNPLPEKVFQTLTYFVRHPGRLVTKHELLEAVWDDAVVEENSLAKAVFAIRHALNDRPDNCRYIVTVPKHGYRFIADVRRVQPETVESPSLSRNVFGRRSVIWSGVITLLLFTTVIGMLYLPRKPQEKRGTDNEEAHKFYMMALNLSEERGTQKVFKALEYIDKAVELDPNFALAWAAKAHLHNDVMGHSNSDPHDQYPRSLEAANKALSFDSELADAYSAICQYKNRYEYDNIGAEKACKRALELDPRSPVAHKIYANFLYTQGRFDEAVAEIKMAMHLQPVSYRNQQMYALTLYYARRFDEAEDQFKRLIELNPDHSFIHGFLIKVLEQQGREDGAFEYLTKMLVMQGAGDEELNRFTNAFRTSGWKGVVLEQIKKAENTPNHFGLARLYAKIGDRNKAFANLNEAVRRRSQQIAIISVDPELDPLRGDPRYNALLSGLESR